jgi:hypothetical protein
MKFFVLMSGDKFMCYDQSTGGYPYLSSILASAAMFMDFNAAEARAASDAKILGHKLRVVELVPTETTENLKVIRMYINEIDWLQSNTLCDDEEVTNYLDGKLFKSTFYQLVTMSKPDRDDIIDAINKAIKLLREDYEYYSGLLDFNGVS